MAGECHTGEGVEPSAERSPVTGDADGFAAAIVFDRNRELFEAWRRMTAERGLPAFHTFFGGLDRGRYDYLYAWTTAPGNEDLLGYAFSPFYVEFLGNNPVGETFSFHAPGPLGRRMLSVHLRCALEGTPFVVLRSRHPYIERSGGYEGLILPCLGRQRERRFIVGHLAPFSPPQIACQIGPPGLVNIGLRYRPA
jgi:hypothetical protein